MGRKDKIKKIITQAVVVVNALGHLELDLQGCGLHDLESIRFSDNNFTSLCVSNNEIRILEIGWLMSRLRSIYVSNNEIFSVRDGLNVLCPNLEMLIVSFNDI